MNGSIETEMLRLCYADTAISYDAVRERMTHLGRATHKMNCADRGSK